MNVVPVIVPGAGTPRIFDIAEM